MMLGWQAETAKGMISWSSGRKRDASVSIPQLESLMKEEYKFLLKQGAKGVDAFARLS